MVHKSYITVSLVEWALCLYQTSCVSLFYSFPLILSLEVSLYISLVHCIWIEVLIRDNIGVSWVIDLVKFQRYYINMYNYIGLRTNYLITSNKYIKLYLSYEETRRLKSWSDSNTEAFTLQEEEWRLSLKEKALAIQHFNLKKSTRTSRASCLKRNCVVSDLVLM